MAVNFANFNRLGKVQYLKGLKGSNGVSLTATEISMFLHESSYLTRPTAKNNFIGMQATVEDARQGNVKIVRSHENYDVVIKEEGENEDGTKVSEANIIKRYKKRLAGTGSSVVSITGTGSNKQFNTEQAFKTYDHIEDSIDDMRRVIRDGKYATDPNYPTLINNMRTRVVQSLFDKDIPGGDIGETKIDVKGTPGDAGPQFDKPVAPSAAPVFQEDPLDTFLEKNNNFVYKTDPRDNYANQINKLDLDYDERLDGSGMDQRNNNNDTEIV